MLVIHKLLTVVRTTETDTVAAKIIAEYKLGDWSSDAHLTALFGTLQPLSLQLTTAIKRIKAESDLEEKDEKRDDKVRAVHYLVKGFLQHPDEVIKIAAQKVDSVFEHYGLEIINESYAEESSLIESLLIEFAKPEVQAAITVLPGLSQVVDDLRAAQTSFAEAQLLFQSEKATEGGELNATELKKEVLDVINKKLIVYLNAMVQVDEEKYTAFAGVIAQIINDMNVIIKRRKTSSSPDPIVN